MTGLMSAFLAANWRAISAVVLIGGLVFAVVAHVQHDRSMVLKLETVTANRDAWKATAEGFKAGFEQSERLRAAERSTALTDAKAASDTCEARVASARRSQAAIRSIVERPPTVVNGCPVRESVGAGELRGAVQ